MYDMMKGSGWIMENAMDHGSNHGNSEVSAALGGVNVLTNLQSGRHRTVV
jgi:hypothetical protein